MNGLWWLAGGGWLLVAFGVGVVVGRVIHMRDRQRPDEQAGRVAVS